MLACSVAKCSCDNAGSRSCYRCMQQLLGGSSSRALLPVQLKHCQPADNAALLPLSIHSGFALYAVGYRFLLLTHACFIASVLIRPFCYRLPLPFWQASNPYRNCDRCRQDPERSMVCVVSGIWPKAGTNCSKNCDRSECGHR
jgi:hypothetical protein